MFKSHGQEEENIYDVDKKPDIFLEKPTFYKSKFREQVKMEYEAVKDSHRTMGYAEVPLNPPNEFLKKDQGIRKPRPSVSHEQIKQKDTVSDIDEDGAKQRTTTKYLKRGKSGAVPRKIVLRSVDKSNGDFYDVKKSGLMPSYVHSSNFGKLPKYLVQRNKDMQEKKEAAEEAERLRQSTCRYISQEDRDDLMRGLKQSWAELQCAFLALPIIIDTSRKIMRKKELEVQLKGIEKDIIFLESHPNIFIYDGETAAITQPCK